MRRSLRALLGMALAVLLIQIGHASRADPPIFQWTDGRGAIHFTTELRDVPPAERSAARDRVYDPRPSRLQTYSTSSGGAETKPGTAAVSVVRPALPALPGRTLTIPFERRDTLMVVDVILNDRVRAPFLVDTGASGVSIPAAVVQRLGIRVDSDTPRLAVQTAAGVVSEAVIRLDSIQVGEARVERLEALVNSSMDIGLLGGSFFNNFVYEVDAAAQRMTLRSNERVRAGLSEGQWRHRFTGLRVNLARLESSLEGDRLLRPERRDELEQGLSEVRDALDALQREANAAGVPRTWRE